MNTLLGFIREAQDELIGELEIRVDQLDKGETICEQLRQKHGLSTEAASILWTPTAVSSISRFVRMEMILDYSSIERERYSLGVHANSRSNDPRMV